MKPSKIQLVNHPFNEEGGIWIKSLQLKGWLMLRNQVQNEMNKQVKKIYDMT